MQKIEHALEVIKTLLDDTLKYISEYIKEYESTGIPRIEFASEGKYTEELISPEELSSTLNLTQAKILLNLKILKLLKEQIDNKKLIVKTYSIFEGLADESRSLLSSGGLVSAYTAKGSINYHDPVSSHINSYLETQDAKLERLSHRIIKLQKYDDIEDLEIVAEEQLFDIVVNGIFDNSHIKRVKLTVNLFSLDLILEDEIFEAINSASNLFSIEIAGGYIHRPTFKTFIDAIKAKLNQLDQQRDFVFFLPENNIIFIKNGLKILCSPLKAKDALPKSIVDIFNLDNSTDRLQALIQLEDVTLFKKITEDNWSPLDYSVWKNDILCLKYLTSIRAKYSDANATCTILHYASQYCPDRKILDYLANFEEIAALVDIKGYTDTIPGQEVSTLDVAAYLGNLDIVECLVTVFKATINPPNSMDFSSTLKFAMQQSNFDVVAYLLRAGARFDDALGKQFQDICNSEKEHSLKSLLHAKQNIYNALLNDISDKLIELASQPGIDVNHGFDFKEGHSLLFLAVQHKKFSAYGYLISLGADFTEKEKQKESLSFGDEIDQQEFAREVQHYLGQKKLADAIPAYLASCTQIRCSSDVDISPIEIYQRLYSNPLIKPILAVFEFVTPKPIITIDVLNDDVGHILPDTYAPAEGTTLGLFRPANNQIYIANRNRLELEGTLIHELTHFACKLVYQNGSYPYNEDMTDAKAKMSEILTKYSEQIVNLQKTVELTYITKVFEYPAEKYHKELIVRVPQILAVYGKRGEDILRVSALELFKYYQDILLPDCINYSSKMRKQRVDLQASLIKAEQNAFVIFRSNVVGSGLNVDLQNNFDPRGKDRG